jgi:hypothetical protein
MSLSLIHAEAVFERALIELADRVGNMVLDAGDVGEAQVELLDPLVLDQFQYVLGCSCLSQLGPPSWDSEPIVSIQSTCPQRGGGSQYFLLSR